MLGRGGGVGSGVSTRALVAVGQEGKGGFTH